MALDQKPTPASAGSAGLDARAVALALLLVVAGGWAYRTVDAQLNGTGEKLPLPRGTLAAIPAEFSGWTGREAPLEESVFRAADCDDALQRYYTQPGDYKAIGLYIAAGVRTRDLVPHRPDVCYPSNGFTLRLREPRAVKLSDGRTVNAVLYRFDHANLNASNILVLNFYWIRGHTAPDVETLRKAARGGQAAGGHVAQVQITRGFRGDAPDDAAVATMESFATAAIPQIERVIAKAETAAGSSDR